MKKISCDEFFSIEDFVILDRKSCHFYNDDETPFSAMNVHIGNIVTYIMDIDGVKISKTPITRWITEDEFSRLKKNSGAIIF